MDGMDLARKVADRWLTASLVRPGDERIFLDISDLSGEKDPISLKEFIEVNEGEDVEPPDPREIQTLRHLQPGASAHLSIGGGHVTIKRVRMS